MLTFTPQYHREIDSGEHAGSWVAVTIGVGRSDTYEGLCHEEAIHIQKEGGSVLCFDPKAGPEDMETARRIQEFLKPQG